MTNRSSWRPALVFTALAAMVFGSGTALAEGGHGGGGGGGHGFSGHGGYAGHGGYGGRGGYGGYRGGYGYGGYRGGYGWRGGYYGGWGWGLGGLGLGLYFGALPLYYSTLWWGGVPYYYANDTYYVYDGNVGQYETVAPPPGLQNPDATAQEPVGTDLIAYPKNGQTTDQQAKDKYECHHWATTQSGFDPTQGAAAPASAGKRTDYMRAQAACLEGRGYTVK